MSFIIKQGDAAINLKITTIGRQMLAYGSLNFSKFAVGDSEIDYQSLANDSYDGGAAMVLRPVDNQPDIKFPIPKITQDVTARYPVSLPYPSDNQIVNTARERGFFQRKTPQAPYSLRTDTDFIRKTVSVTGADGSRTVNLAGPSGAAAGDFALIQWFTPNNNTSNAAAGELNRDNPTHFIWYKITSVGGNSIILDRNAPNFNGQGSGNLYVYPGGDSIKSYYGPDSPGDYWDESLLSFNAAQNATYTDVPVWNLSIVYGLTVPGVSDTLQHNSYPTKIYEGLRAYLANNFYSRKSVAPIGVVHYTNYTVDNFYGEGFFKDTFTLELPTVMYHSQTSNKLGLTLKAGGTKKLLSNFGGILATPYYDLNDGFGRIVGKVFIDLKIAIIEDGEILAALSYTSNRNWTMPALTQFIATPDDVDTDTAQTLWLTYRFSNTPNTDNFDTGASTSYGFQNTLHNQNFAYVPKVEASNLDYVEFKFDYNSLHFLVDAANVNTANGSGYVFNRLFIMFQYTNVGESPVYDRWVEIDYTPNLQGYDAFASGAITRSSLAAQFYRLSGNAMREAIDLALNGTTKFYSIDYLGNLGQLNFGEEVFCLGNVKTDIQATSYQTRFSILLNAGEFASSRNPTWTLGTPVYITEVGIYDDKDNLVATGKVNIPIRKDAYSLRFITADLDF